MLVFKVFPQNRVRQRLVPSRSSTSLLVEVFKVSSQDRVRGVRTKSLPFPLLVAGLQDFLPGQSSSSSSHDPARVHEDADELGQVVFSHFSPSQKSATQPPHSGSELPPHSNPWTPAACDVPMVLEVEEEECEDEPDFAVEYVECDGHLWGCEWAPARQQYCWWLAAADGPRLAMPSGGLHGSSAAGQVQGRRQPCHGAEDVFLGPVQQTPEIPKSQSIDTVFDIPLVQVQQILGCRL